MQPTLSESGSMDEASPSVAPPTDHPICRGGFENLDQEFQSQCSQQAELNSHKQELATTMEDLKRRMENVEQEHSALV